jgi:hypothetical protein
MAMVTTVETRPGTNPDRASCTTALETARDQLVAAAGICPDGPAGLATLLPARRPRYSAAKSNAPPPATSTATTAGPHTVTTITQISVTITAPPPPGPTSNRRPHRRTTRLGPQPPTRRQLITSHPPRDWSGHELALMLGVKPRSILTQLREWALLGFFVHSGFGTYALSTPSRPASSTTEPDP